MSVLRGLAVNNRALAAKNAIQELGEYRFHCPLRTVAMVQNLACLTFNHRINPVFAPLDADLNEVGRCMEAFHDELDSHMDDYVESDIFVYGGQGANIENFERIMCADGGLIVNGAAAFVIKMVEEWFLAASQFEEARRHSAQLQLDNMGVPQEDIDAVINDPLKLRQFIAEQRQALIRHLTEIKGAKELNDPMFPITDKEAELYAKHRDWFENGELDDTDYLPNDAAVNYPMLLVEIMSMVVNAGATGPRLVFDATKYMICVMNAHMTRQSSRVGWTRLASIGSINYFGVNIGELIMNYVTDGNRCLDHTEKLASPLARSPLRVCRLAQCLFDQAGPFSLLNAGHDVMMEKLIECRSKEERIKELVHETRFIQEGAVDLFISTTVAWLVVMERYSLLNVVTGRNDLSVPKLLATITHHNMDAFADLQPRTWALMHDIQGRKADGESIEEAHFAIEHVLAVAGTAPPGNTPSLPQLVPSSSNLATTGVTTTQVQTTVVSGATTSTVPSAAGNVQVATGQSIATSSTLKQPPAPVLSPHVWPAPKGGSVGSNQGQGGKKKNKKFNKQGGNP